MNCFPKVHWCEPVLVYFVCADPWFFPEIVLAIAMFLYLFFLMKINNVSMTKLVILCSFLKEVSGEVHDILLPHLLRDEKKRSLEPSLPFEAL